jgi:transglutaminase-like putative cysteine protease
LSILRTAGLAARYVSGHLLGESGTHAWVEVLVPAPARPGLLTVGVTSVEYGLTRG